MIAGGYGPAVAATSSSPAAGPYSSAAAAPTGNSGVLTAVKSLPTVQGTMKAWYPEKGYGFATIDSGIDVFVHIVDCVGGFPAVGDRLRLEVEHSQKPDGSSHWKAKNVQGGSAPLTGAAASNSSIGVAPCNSPLPTPSKEKPAGAGDTMGLLKAWNLEKGFGFCSVDGSGDVFVHIADCVGAQPMIGDTLWFDVEQGAKKDGSVNLKAKKVMGGTGAVVGGSAASNAPPITPGSGLMTGKLKSWNAEKGFGFLHAEGIAEIFVHIADCIGSQPTVGDTLTFEVEQGTKRDGSINYRAKNVKGGSMSAAGAAFAGASPTDSGLDAATAALPSLGGGQVSGKVKSWNTEKGFGFAAVAGCGDIFVHVADCIDAQPTVGDTIAFEIEQGTKKDGSANYRARNVKGGSVPLRSGDGLSIATTAPSLAASVAAPQYDYAASLAAYGYACAGYAYPSSQPGVATVGIPAYGYLQAGQPGMTAQQPTLAMHQPTVQMQQPSIAVHMQQPGVAVQMQQPGVAVQMQQLGIAAHLQQPGVAVQLQQPGVASQLQQPAVQLQLQQPGMLPTSPPPTMLHVQQPAMQPAAVPIQGLAPQQHAYMQLYTAPVATAPAAEMPAVLSPAAPIAYQNPLAAPT